MKSVKRILALSLCLIMVLGMLACGEQEKDPTVITYWSRSMGDLYEQNMDALIAEYNALNRGYTVQVEWLEKSVWDEKIVAARASGTAPDIMNVSYSWINEGVVNGYFLPIDDLVSADVLNDIVPAVKDKVTMVDKTYAMPLYVESSMLLFYRKDILAAAGYNEAPTTWDEVIEIAKKVQNEDMFGLSVPYFGAGFAWCTEGMQYGLVGHHPLNDNWDTALVGAEYKPFFELFKRFYDEGVVPDQALAIYDRITPFAQGIVAMQLCGAWAITELQTTYAEMEVGQNFNEMVGIAKIPSFSNAVYPETTATGGGWAIAIDSKTDKAEGAADFISWLFDKEHPERMGNVAVDEGFCRAVTTNTLMEYVNNYAKEMNIEYAEVINSVAAGAINEHKYLYDINIAIENAAQSYAMGYESDLDKVLADCNAAIQKIIDSNRLAGTNPENPQ